MKKIKVIALTEKGAATITKNMIDSQKSREGRFMAKRMGYSISIVEEEPKTMELRLTGTAERFVKLKNIKQQVIDNMEHEGAIIEKDFNVEAEE